MSSLFSRKLDLTYVIFFCMHIPITILIDSALVIPPENRFSLQKTILDFHIQQNNDVLLINPPSWLVLFGWIEMVFQLPTFFIGVYKLINNNATVYPLILAYGVNATITTLGCIAQIYSFESTVLTDAEKMNLILVYCSTLFPAVMIVDMTSRISGIISKHQRADSTKKVK